MSEYDPDEFSSFETLGDSYTSASHIDGTDENLPASNIEKRKKAENRLVQVFGDKIPSKDLPLAINQYNVLTRLLHTLVDIKELLEDKVPKGIIYNYGFSLAANDPLIHMDFEESEDSDIPVSIRPLNFPQQKLFEVTIVNDGPAEISFMTNLPRSVKESIANLKTGESAKVGPFNKAIIKSLKIVNKSTTQAAAIRVRTLI